MCQDSFCLLIKIGKVLKKKKKKKKKKIGQLSPPSTEWPVQSFRLPFFTQPPMVVSLDLESSTARSPVDTLPQSNAIYVPHVHGLSAVKSPSDTLVQPWANYGPQARSRPFEMNKTKKKRPYPFM
uniref:Uncharacterized protein n=1 Tax=Myotis myotis TaxID=51298 RepID=A0A7J7ZXE5_MYOMY|nr:hypothetical protein mMyoMyo1_009806 [Myotis myotis]